MFFIWLNDTTFERHYWSQPAQNWTTNFDDATKFDKEAAATAELPYCYKTTLAEVIVQEYNPQ